MARAHTTRRCSTRCRGSWTAGRTIGGAGAAGLRVPGRVAPQAAGAVGGGADGGRGGALTSGEEAAEGVVGGGAVTRAVSS